VLSSYLKILTAAWRCTSCVISENFDRCHPYITSCVQLHGIDIIHHTKITNRITKNMLSSNNSDYESLKVKKNFMYIIQQSKSQHIYLELKQYQGHKINISSSLELIFSCMHLNLTAHHN
jgi:hypothetical protein